MSSVPVEVLLVAPLSVAAGVDLYLTLLVLGVAPATGFWDGLPGALGDLHAGGIVVVLSGLYLAEVVAERWSTSAVFWNALHAVMRPLAGALLALMLLDGLPLSQRLAGTLAGALAVPLIHAVRSGTRVLWWLSGRRLPATWLMGLAEDVAVVAWVVLALDRPRLTSLLALLVLAAALPLGGARVRAFVFAVRLSWDHLWAPLTGSRWTEGRALPRWLRTALTSEAEGEPMGRLRGVRAGAYRLPRAGRFRSGWLVLRGSVPLFVRHSRRGARVLDLRALRIGPVTRGEIYTTVELTASGSRASRIHLSRSAPEPERLSADLAS